MNTRTQIKNKIKSLKRFSDIIVRGSFTLIIIGGILLNIIYWIQGEPFQGINIILITIVFLFFYIYLEKYFTEKLYFIPPSFYYIAIIFGFFSTYLGSYLNFYEKFYYWDDLLHFTSGILLGLLCISLTNFFIYRRFGSISKKTDILFMIIVGVMVSISLAVFWEFYEFLFDYITDGNMQRSIIVTNPEQFHVTEYLRPSGRFVDPGLLDTMGDFFLAVAGSIIIGAYCFTHYALLYKAVKEIDSEYFHYKK